MLPMVIVAWQRRHAAEKAKLEEAANAEAMRQAEAAEAEATRQAEAAEAEARRREEAIAADVKLRKVQIRSVAAMLCVTTILSFFAIYQWRKADNRSIDLREQTRIAEEKKKEVEEQSKKTDIERKLSQSSVLAAKAISLLGDDPDLSLALAVEALDRAKTASADGALRQALAQVWPRTVLGSDVHSRMISIAYDHDGGRVATTRVDGRAEVWNTATGAARAELRHHKSGQA